MTKQIIYFLVLSDTLLIDLTGPADAFLFANRHLGEISFELRYISARSSIDTSIGLSLHQLSPLPTEIEEHALIVIPGVRGDSFDHHTPTALESINWLKQHVNSSHRIACVCGRFDRSACGLIEK